MRIFFSALIAIALSLPAFADDYLITIKDHKFSPAELVIPANQKIKVTVKNEDPSPEEFESFELNREKVVGANSQIIVFIGPLSPGSYKYFGDFHRDSANGIITAK